MPDSFPKLLFSNPLGLFPYLITRLFCLCDSIDLFAVILPDVALGLVSAFCLVLCFDVNEGLTPLAYMRKYAVR